MCGRVVEKLHHKTNDRTLLYRICSRVENVGMEIGDMGYAKNMEILGLKLNAN